MHPGAESRTRERSHARGAESCAGTREVTAPGGGPSSAAMLLRGGSRHIRFRWKMPRRRAMARNGRPIERHNKIAAVGGKPSGARDSGS